jgi:hypothetical protein
MNRYVLLGLASSLLFAGVAGCGDNSAQCGVGTVKDDKGFCVPDGTGAPVTCSDGTVLDTATNSCVIDPDACQDGTVLVGGACVDPAHVTVDVTEGAEPNGLGLLGESSTNPAGTITIKPVGEHFVLKGMIKPFQDLDGDGQLDPDIDAYVLQLTGPTLVTITADGLHGLAAAFIAISGPAVGEPLASWQRFGMNVTGDASKRQLYFPAAGTYVVAITDTRSLLLGNAAPAAESGKPELEYYVTIDQHAAPAPTALTVTDGVATSTGSLAPGEVKFFTVPMGLGINTAELAFVNADDDLTDFAIPSMVIANTRNSVSTLKHVEDGNPTGTSSLGYRSGDQTLVVVDHVLNYAVMPVTYDLVVEVGGAGALSTSGDTVDQPASDEDLTVFFYDVDATNAILGLDLAMDRPVVGVLFDENFQVAANFTYDPDFGFAFQEKFSTYLGLVRHRFPGRYYLVVYDPAGGTADIEATSTIEPISAVAVTTGTPLTNQTVNAYEQNPFTYVPGATNPWVVFDASGTGTGTIFIDYLDASDAYGLLRIPQDSECGSLCADVFPVFTHSHAAAGQPRGRILLDDAVGTYLATVDTTNGTGTFDLDYAAQTFHDYGTLAVGETESFMDHLIDATTPERRYLFRTASLNRPTITVNPSGTLDNTQIRLLNRDEGVTRTVNNGILGEDDFVTYQQVGGWTAFTVSSAISLPAVGTTYTATVSVAGQPYMVMTTATAFADACTNGVAVALTDPDEGRSSTTYETPSGFEFFGASAANLRVFSNGFLTFDTALACAFTGFDCFYSNADIPTTSAPNLLVAPYWDDLDDVQVCTEVDGTKRIVQWTGRLFASSTRVEFQAILDGADDTIEFVYGPNHQANGSRATIGLENAGATLGVKVGFNQSVVTANSSRKLTPDL